jgi:hypothetical protein
MSFVVGDRYCMFVKLFVSRRVVNVEAVSSCGLFLSYPENVGIGMYSGDSGNVDECVFLRNCKEKLSLMSPPLGERLKSWLPVLCLRPIDSEETESD